MLKRRINLFIAPLTCLMLLIGASCGSSDDHTNVKLILDWFPNSNHAGFYTALNEGYFDEQGLSVDITPPSDPTAIIATVASGDADFGISYNMDVIQARAAGVEVVSVLALVQHPLVSIMTLPSSDIVSPADLEGKLIGYPGIASQAGMLDTILKSAELTRDDVELSNVGFDLVQQLLAGNVDAILGAYFTHESIRIEQENGSFPNIIRVEEHGVPDYYELLLITNEHTLADHPDMVDKFVTAVRQGFNDAFANQQGSIDAILAVAGAEAIDEELEREGVKLLAPFWTDEGAVEFGTQLSDRWAEVAEWMLDNDLIQVNVDVDASFTNMFLDE